MGWVFYFFGWFVGLAAGVAVIMSMPVVVTVQQQTVLWIQGAVAMLGFVLAALGALMLKRPPSD